MLLSDLLRESLDTATLECREREQTGTPVRAFAVRLHATRCSLSETKGILALLGVKRPHQAIFQWVHRVSNSVPVIMITISVTIWSEVAEHTVGRMTTRVSLHGQERAPIPSGELKQFGSGECVIKARQDWWIGRTTLLDDVRDQL
jgi:hypothetical protein